MKLIAEILSVMLGLIAAEGVNAAVLTFDQSNACVGGACVDDGWGQSHIKSDYGSQSGVTISYSANVGQNYLRWWGTQAHQYGDLTSVAWATPDWSQVGSGTNLDCCSVAQIKFQVAAGSTFTLNSWDIAAYYPDLHSSVNVFDLFGNTIWSTGDFLAPIAGHLHQTCVGCTTTTGLILQFGPTATNVGISNIDFTITSVPEPGTLPLLALGLGAAVMAARRKLA